MAQNPILDTPPMATDKDQLNTTLAFAVTCLLALAISIHLIIKQFFINPKKKQSCYLYAESKPQHSFKRVLADNSYSQFKHLLNLQTPEDLSNLHPYNAEVSVLLKNPNVGFLDFLGECFNGNEGLKMEGSYVWVEKEAQLVELVEVLSKESVFAVDTEQHSFRSFLGFTALVQISTIKEDYLVDTINLHDVMGILRPVFANPAICKVFHGADNDVLWLQRDFHIYVVNLFDTAKACDVLSKPQRSLAYLLETCCGVATNKLFQREDWRQRPLPEEMVQYARKDAHYLLYIAYCLCLELKHQKNENSSPGDKFHFLLEASRRSNSTCLQLFAKDTEACPGELAASSIVSRCLNDQGNILSSLCDSKFQEHVRRLCLWRDIMARIHDESLRFVLSENAITALATKTPRTEGDMWNVISKADLDVGSTTLVPLQSPSPVVSSHLEDLLCLFRGNITNLDNLFDLFIKQHLGRSGSCPLSAYNYALLSKTTLRLNNRTTSKRNPFRASKQVAKRASRESFVKKFSCKSPVYHNCKIYANDGRLLCYCDRRKLEWYISRDLAKLVEEDPPSIMLLFEPKGRPEDEGNDFYIHSKKNICVGCGEGNHYLRYRVIPSCYRIHFPEHLKSHRSHDIVLLCVDCHEIAHAAAEKYKKQVAAEFRIPLFVRSVVDFDQTQDLTASSLLSAPSEEVGVSPLQLRIAAMALLRHGLQMPSQRRETLMQIVIKYYGGREISGEDLERALLVGMSPHERKKFEKKRGYTFKHFSGRKDLNDEKEDDIGSKTNVSIQNLVPNEKNTNMLETDQKQDYVNISIVDHAVISTQRTAFDANSEMADISTVISTQRTAFDANSEIADISTVPDIGYVSDPNSGVIPGTENKSQEVGVPAHAGDSALKNESKMSLLGHGPHGKQVVEHLVKEYGEDGVREFCQRWRQVFVEALHPRFLPAGWDVNHSGKREFGEFSVYNPAKRA